MELPPANTSTDVSDIDLLNMNDFLVIECPPSFCLSFGSCHSTLDDEPPTVSISAALITKVAQESVIATDACGFPILFCFFKNVSFLETYLLVSTATPCIQLAYRDCKNVDGMHLLFLLLVRLSWFSASSVNLSVLAFLFFFAKTNTPATPMDYNSNLSNPVFVSTLAPHFGFV